MVSQDIFARPPQRMASMKQREKTRKRIAFFGHFNSTNFGNESTLQTILYHLRRFVPDADVTCISTGPVEATIATHNVHAIPIAETFLKSWVPRNSIARTVRKICIGLPSEPYRWFTAFRSLRGTDVLIVPGTGLLTDAYGLFGWGPYSLLKWSLIAKLCGCKLLFVSMGAGPIYGFLGKYFIKLVLSLADFRSYRDESSKRCVEGIGFRRGSDRVYPDLVFSLPEVLIPHQNTSTGQRPVVGLGLMSYAEKYSVSRPSNDIYASYLINLVKFTIWLLANEYDVRLLIGELGDTRVTRDFKRLLRDQLPSFDRIEGRILDESVSSVAELLSQIATTDFVVATRFHNVLIALLCSKPALAISFHHKCESLMSAMGLSDYCLDINDLHADRLIDKFCELRRNTNKLMPLIRDKQRKFREQLDEQYSLIFSGM
jgi:polysaccharide pyruvyl transferase WcaK-like protein